MAAGKAPKKKKEKPKGKPKSQEKEEEGIRGIVRLAGKDLSGHLPIKRALLKVRGISHTTARIAADAINSELKISPDTKAGELSDEQIEKVDNVLFNLHKYGGPKFIFNRRKDYVSNENVHVIMNDLIFANEQDVEREKRTYSWRGYRHAYGQKTRGQRTRNTGRKGMAVGVLRKSIIAQQKGAGGKEGGKEKK